MTAIEFLKPEHCELVAGWLAHSQINQWLTTEWRQRAASGPVVAVALRNKRNRLFLVTHDGFECGLAALADIDLGDRTAMVWYLLGDSRVAGRGVVTEAVRRVARHGFDEMGLRCIYAWIMEDNAPSRRVLEKNGFREVGRLRQATLSNGRQVDRIYFDLIPEDVGRSVP